MCCVTVGRGFGEKEKERRKVWIECGTCYDQGGDGSTVMIVCE